MDGTPMEINMLVEKKYPLIKELLEKMLNLQLEAEEESTMAFELIKFIKSMLEEGGLLGILSYYCQYYFNTAGSRLILLWDEKNASRDDFLLQNRALFIAYE
ncbi:hypothetical protein Tco_0710381 [Tanacetum coccineum]